MCLYGAVLRGTWLFGLVYLVDPTASRFDEAISNAAMLNSSTGSGTSCGLALACHAYVGCDMD
jgi:hypothetical protein